MPAPTGGRWRTVAVHAAVDPDVVGGRVDAPGPGPIRKAAPDGGTGVRSVSTTCACW